MFILYAIIACSPINLSFDHKIHTERESTEPVVEITPCSIDIISQLDADSPHMQLVVRGADDITMQLTMYEGREVLERRLELNSDSEYALEMFWPMETPNHSWQQAYGTQATLQLQGNSEDGASCDAQFTDSFASFADQLHMYDLISNIQWNVPKITVQGLLVSVPPMHEPDKFALISTPISYTILSVLGPFERDDGFVDISNLGLYETSEGRLLSLVSQEGWPGFGEQLFLRHNVISGEVMELLTLDTNVHHTLYITEEESGALDILTSIWDYRGEQYDSRSGYISYPTRITLDAEQELTVTPLVDKTEIYPNSQKSPLTYNNFVWPADPTGLFVGSVIFANSATSLPPPEENSSSIWLYNTQTQESWWFANGNNIEEVHLYPERVIALEDMPDVGLGLAFPHGIQFDGTRLYVQDHIDVDAGSTPSRINAFDLNGTLLWDYLVPNASEVTQNARRRHGGIWLLTTEDKTGVCGFFVDTQATYCADQDGTEIAVLRKDQLSEHQGDKWHMVTYLKNWKNTFSSLQ